MAGMIDETQNDNQFVREIIESLESRRPKSDHERTHLVVAKITTPISATTIRQALDPALGGMSKMEAAIRVNNHEVDKLRQYGRRENLRISVIPEENGEDLRKTVINMARSINVEIPESAINVVHRNSRVKRVSNQDRYFVDSYEGISKSFEPNMERARNLDLFCFIFQRSPLPTPHTCPI